MPGDISIRQRIITNIVETLRAPGVLRSVVDSEPTDYLRAPVPAAWVIEGSEEIITSNLDSLADCRLTVLVQIAYAFHSADPQRTLYRVGRGLLAQVQEWMTADFARGGWAFFTQEVGNAIGAVDAQDGAAVGVLTTEWVIHYHRKNTDPFRK
jgi:hypothetical protein